MVSTWLPFVDAWTYQARITSSVIQRVRVPVHSHLPCSLGRRLGRATTYPHRRRILTRATTPYSRRNGTWIAFTLPTHGRTLPEECSRRLPSWTTDFSTLTEICASTSNDRLGGTAPRECVYPPRTQTTRFTGRRPRASRRRFATTCAEGAASPGAQRSSAFDYSLTERIRRTTYS